VLYWLQEYEGYEDKNIMDNKRDFVKKLLITGSEGFVGSNLCSLLESRDEIELYKYDLKNNISGLYEALKQVDCIIHLAGVNRPERLEEFESGNAGSLEIICSKLQEFRKFPKIVLSSSIQAELDNPYGISKRHAEEILQKYAENNGAECVVYRLKNLFGKWCKPNYNSVTATFCYNIANDIPIQITDQTHEIDLTYIDDVVEAFINELESVSPGFRFAKPLYSKRISLRNLAKKIKSFHRIRTSLNLPDFRDTFERRLYATYLSYLNEQNFEYDLNIQSDKRGSLAEFLKSTSMGQIFVSRTNPGVTRGNHYHHTKTEKFLVLQGEAIICFRHINSDKVLKYQVRGEDYRVLDIPPGYTHSIENVGQYEVVTLFWSSEMFDPVRPDTYFEKV
jgi:UDP-2-acetamido-2,6-beta-L-arabino-hexul-4-ose reductase